MSLLDSPLKLVPEYRDYIWGGNRLRPEVSPTAEAWVVDGNDRIADGPLSGKTLAEASKEFGADLLGSVCAERTGFVFPLLIKLLDCAAWLSLQVHPNDEQAARLEGPGFFGKTEAWHILDALSGARLIAGLLPGTTAKTLSQSIRNGTILENARYLHVRPGDTILSRAGTIHALGPGLLIYEVQQPSDLTYRVYDWGRPQTSGRMLHIEKSLEVADPSAEVKVTYSIPTDEGKWHALCRCQYFTLEMVSSETLPVSADTHGKSFHALTVIEGSCDIVIKNSITKVNCFDSVVIPAVGGIYEVRPNGKCRMLRAFVE
jgi:mannose-6-phosphate isomerase